MIDQLLSICNHGMEEMDMNNDEEELEIPHEVVNEAIEAHQHSLIVRPANPSRQNLRPLIRFLPRLWGMDDVVLGRLIPYNRAQFIFPSREAMDSVMRRGPWNFNDWMLSSGVWHDNIPTAYPDSILFWIQIRDVPVQFFTQTVINRIADTLGERVESDFNSASANARDFARVRVNWPLQRPLCFQRRFRFGSQAGVLVLFRFERLRNYCLRCRSLCHDEAERTAPDNGRHYNPVGHDDAGPSTGSIRTSQASLSMGHQQHMLPASNTPLQIGASNSSSATNGPSGPLLLTSSAALNSTPSDMINLNGMRVHKSVLSSLYHSYVPVEPASNSDTQEVLFGSGSGHGATGRYEDRLLQSKATRYYKAKRKRVASWESVGECSVGECSGTKESSEEATKPDHSQNI